MNYRAGLSPDGSSWLVERSENGLHPEVIASRLPSAKHARAFIDAREGLLRPSRGEADGSPLRQPLREPVDGSGTTAAPLGLGGSAAER